MMIAAVAVKDSALSMDDFRSAVNDFATVFASRANTYIYI